VLSSRVFLVRKAERPPFVLFQLVWFGVPEQSGKDRLENAMNLYKELPAGGFCLDPDIIAKVGAEFDRLAKLIASGIGGFRGFQPDELNALTAIIQEKKNEFLAGVPEGSWFQYWKLNTRVHDVFRNDARAKTIYEARQARRPGIPMPMRYIGFRDDAECRVFRFSTLPEDQTAEVRRVHVPLPYFMRNGLALQEGPAFGVRLLEREQTVDYKATREDVEQFRADIKTRVVKK
jgi:hypothetical protein